ncbi:unnamed protein product [Cylindrotheca closterium]|uniref:Uncharacterized protein n=1 Tax=Cylindrotheca closterium TaxID=2856 RepID=A0AAD2FR09_9STRA|nr:unnamed protein product [Cylindrotheca closterium]
MNPLSSVESSFVSVAIAAICLGYGAKTIQLEEISENVDNLIMPLYRNLVILYLALRIYDKLKATIEKRISAKAVPPHDDEAMRLAKNAEQPVDLTGTFKLIKNENFGPFLAAQGVPWALRGAANAARPTHKITHQGNMITIAIKGPLKSSSTYTIGGEPVPARIRGRRFEDSVSYIESGVCTTKRACDDGYVVKVDRVLSPDKNEIRMKSSVVFDDESKEKIESFQLFQRVE